MTPILRACVLALFASLAAGVGEGAARAPAEALAVALPGLTASDERFTIVHVDAADREGVERCRELLREGGGRTLLALRCVGRASYSRPATELLAEADAALGALDLGRVHAVVLGRDNVPWAGGLEALNALYSHITVRYGLPVYQWYAAPLPPHHGQLADGWVVSADAVPRDALRRYLLKYLVTGKPVLNGGAALAAAPMAPERGGLVVLCGDMGVPASFLGAVGGSALGLPGAAVGQGAPGATVAYSLDPLWRRLPAEADHLDGQSIEVGGDRVKRYEYLDDFEQLWCLDDPAVEGLSCLRWDGSVPALHIEGRGPERRRAALTYQFVAPYDMKEMVAYVEGAIEGGKADWVELTMSTDGQEFIHPARACGRPEGQAFNLTSASSYRFDGPEFWIRVAADLAPGSRVTLRAVRVGCRVKPPGRCEVALGPMPEGRLGYRDSFASSRILHLAAVHNLAALEWRRGALFLRGQEGGPAEVVICQKFVAPEPLGAVVARIRNAANQRELGGTNTFGISLDGTHLIASKSTPGPDGLFHGVTELRVDDPAALASARCFFLHITLANGSGRAAEPSNLVSMVEVEARPASRP